MKFNLCNRLLVGALSAVLLTSSVPQYSYGMEPDDIAIEESAEPADDLKDNVEVSQGNSLEETQDSGGNMLLDAENGQEPDLELEADHEHFDTDFLTSGSISFEEKSFSFDSPEPEYSLSELTAKERRLFDILKPEADKILSGENDPNEDNYIYTCQLLEEKLIYAYSELGVEFAETYDPVVDVTALNSALGTVLGADIQKVSRALFAGSEGSISWLPYEGGVQYIRDEHQVCIADQVLWTVRMDIRRPEPAEQEDADEAEEAVTEEEALLTEDNAASEEELDISKEISDKEDLTAEDKENSETETAEDKENAEKEDASSSVLLGTGQNDGDGSSSDILRLGGSNTLRSSTAEYQYKLTVRLNGGFFNNRRFESEDVGFNLVGSTVAIGNILSANAAGQQIIYTDGNGDYQLDTPEKTRFSFAGWTDDGGNPVSASTAVSGNFTINANWVQSVDSKVQAPEALVKAESHKDRAGNLYETALITLQSGTADATIKYRTSGSGEWKTYNDQFKVSDIPAADRSAIAEGKYTVTIQAFAQKDGYGDSEVTSTTFSVLDPAEDYGDIEDADIAVYNPDEKGLWATGINPAGYPYTTVAVNFNGELRVYYGKTRLKEGTDYSVTYKNNVKPGTGTVTITCKGNYSGTRSYNFSIIDVSNNSGIAFGPSNISIGAFEDSLEYNGSIQGQDEAIVYFNGNTELVEGRDYVVSYSKTPLEVGSYKMYFTGCGAYKGTVLLPFKIVPCDITSISISLDNSDAVYHKKGATPKVIVRHKGKDLTLNKDYTLTYKGNTKVSNTADVTITGKGNYSGAIIRSFGVVANTDTDALTVVAADKAFANKAGSYATTLTITDTDGNKLSAGTDYNKNLTYTYVEDTDLPSGITRRAGEAVSALDIVPAGTALRVTAVLKGNFGGIVSADYRIVGQDISKAVVKVGSQFYTGKEVCPEKSQILVTVGKVVLTDKDYDIISYSNNIEKGTAKLTIRGRGEYGGTKEATFTIAQRTTSYMIAYYGNGATSGTMGTSQIAAGAAGTLLANKYVKANYSFAGWNTKADGTGTRYGDQAGIAASAVRQGEVLSLYAQWTPNAVPNYSITYYTNGGSNSALNTVTSYNVLSGDITIYAPEKKDWPDGYQFGGWYKEAAFKTKISVIKSGSTGDIGLYAKWIPYSYTVKFVGNGATSGAVADEAFSYGVSKKLTKNTFKRDGYAFLGWSTDRTAAAPDYKDEELVKDLKAPVNGSGEVVTLYAVWDDRFEISYDLGVEGLTIPSGEYIYGIDTKANALPVPERAGYTFAGWYKDAALKTKLTSIPKTSVGDITVYAKWDPWPYKLEYNGNGNTAGKVAAQNVKTEGATMAACAYKRDGYSFTGWNTKADGTGTTFYTGQVVGRDELAPAAKDQVITLYAVWVDNETYATYYNGRTGYTINFDANAGTAYAGAKATGKTAALKMNYGQMKPLPKNAITIKGYEFVEWNTRSDGSGSSFANQQQVRDLDNDLDGTVTLYAIWSGQEYTLTYKNLAGSNGGNPASYNVNTETIILNPAQGLGQTFEGWYTDAALKKKITSIPKGSTGDKELYAKWTSSQYTISYNLNCNDAVLDTSKAGYISSYNRTDDTGYVLATARRAGYIFGGWYKDVACKTAVGNFTGQPNVDMTVYAKWIKETGHNWRTYRVLSAATCTEDGIEYRICQDCGCMDEENGVMKPVVTPALGHSKIMTSSVAATCTTDGSKTLRCTRCGQVETTTINKFGHYEKVVSSTAATCTTAGTRTIKCERCGLTRTETIPATGHDYVTYTTEPVGCKPGQSYEKCSGCGDVRNEQTIPSDGTHLFGVAEVITEATCATPGRVRKTCLVCGTVVTEQTSLGDHHFEWVVTQEPTSVQSGKRAYTCSVCGLVDRTANVPYGCPHTGLTFTVTRKPATCVSKGTRDVYCNTCGALLIENEEYGNFSTENHVDVTEKMITAPTRTSTGIEEFSCAACGASGKRTIPMLESEPCTHQNTEVTGRNGSSYMWVKCLDCGTYLEQTGTKLTCYHSNYPFEEVTVTAADSHTWGEYKKICSNCGLELDHYKVHPYSTFNLTDNTGKAVTVYGYFDYDWSRRVWELTNEYRVANGLNALHYNTLTQDASDTRALESSIFFAHTRPNGQRWNTLDPRWKYGGENLASGQKTPEAAMVAWMNSEGHNKNLLYGQVPGDTPFKGLSVGAFHQMYFNSSTKPSMPNEILVWSQNFTFYEY